MGFPAAPDWQKALGHMPEGSLALFQPARGPLGARRVARALMEEAAVLGGGQMMALPGGDLLLVAQAAPGQRAGRAIAELTGEAPEGWSMPLGREALEARCREAAAAVPAMPGFADIEAQCAARPLGELACLTLFAEGAGERAVAQRLGPAPLGYPDPMLEAMAREWLCRRLLAALANPDQRGALPSLRPGLRLILDLPREGLPSGTPLQAGRPDDPNRPVALLPLSACAEPTRFAAILAGLRAAGWAVALLAADARALDWVEAPGLGWAVPGAAAAPRQGPPLLIALGGAVPGWCRAAGILHEGVAA